MRSPRSSVASHGCRRTPPEQHRSSARRVTHHHSSTSRDPDALIHISDDDGILVPVADDSSRHASHSSDPSPGPQNGALSTFRPSSDGGLNGYARPHPRSAERGRGGHLWRPGPAGRDLHRPRSAPRHLLSGRQPLATGARTGRGSATTFPSAPGSTRSTAVLVRSSPPPSTIRCS